MNKYVKWVLQPIVMHGTLREKTLIPTLSKDFLNMCTQDIYLRYIINYLREAKSLLFFPNTQGIRVNNTQQTINSLMYDLCLEVQTVYGNGWRLFWTRTFILL